MYCVLAYELHIHMFRLLSGHPQAIKAHKIKIKIATKWICNFKFNFMYFNIWR
jgi:hypothetical protein